MAITYQYPQNIVFQDSGARTRYIDMSNFVIFPPSPLSPDCCELYALPYVTGDIIQFYLQDVPTSLFLEDDEGNNISGNITNNERLIIIDTRTITASGFRAEINGSCLEFHWRRFVREDKECCRSLEDDELFTATTEIYSTYCDRQGSHDLFGNRYDLGNGYTNRIRIFGEFVETAAPQSEITRNDRDVVTRKRYKQAYKLTSNRIYANSWLFFQLTRSTLRGEELFLKSSSMDEFVQVELTSDLGARYGQTWTFQLSFETLGTDIPICC